eukprot:3106172-Rhodomonas_salina.1
MIFDDPGTASSAPGIGHRYGTSTGANLTKTWGRGVVKGHDFYEAFSAPLPLPVPVSVDRPRQKLWAGRCRAKLAVWPVMDAERIARRK